MSNDLQSMHSELNHLPPHSPEAEQGILGCIMLSPNDCLGECVETLKAGAETFYDLRHKTIYSVLTEMFNHHEPVDTITLHERLKSKNRLEDAGGIDYVMRIPDNVPSAANLSSYLGIVQDKYLLRRMLQTCTKAEARVYEHEGEAGALLDEVERDVRVASAGMRDGGGA